MKPKFSFVTNATQADGIRLKYFLPGVIQVFGNLVEEILVIVDHTPEEGRIKRLHQKAGDDSYSLDSLKLQFSETIVSFIDLDYTKQKETSNKWFGTPDINRCQNGTPIFAFLYGIDQCKHENILRSDCDILFYDHGFVEAIKRQSLNYDLMQLPFLSNTEKAFSTRCFFINRSRINAHLPLHPLKLDIARRVHRWIKGRTQYLALEQMLQKEIELNKISALRLNNALGYTMHVPTRNDFVDIHRIVERFKKGDVPKQQLTFSHDYNPSTWTEQK